MGTPGHSHRGKPLFIDEGLAESPWGAPWCRTLARRAPSSGPRVRSSETSVVASAGIASVRAAHGLVKQLGIARSDLKPHVYEPDPYPDTSCETDRRLTGPFRQLSIGRLRRCPDVIPVIAGATAWRLPPATTSQTSGAYRSLSGVCPRSGSAYATAAPRAGTDEPTTTASLTGRQAELRERSWAPRNPLRAVGERRYGERDEIEAANRASQTSTGREPRCAIDLRWFEWLGREVTRQGLLVVVFLNRAPRRKTEDFCGFRRIRRVIRISTLRARVTAISSKSFGSFGALVPEPV